MGLRQRARPRNERRAKFTGATKDSTSRDDVLSFITALNRDGKTDAVLARYSRSPVLNQKIASFELSYPGFRIYPLDACSERDLVAVRYAVGFGTRFAPLVAPDTELLEGIAIFKVREGLITDFWLEADVLTQVIGMNGVDHALRQKPHLLARREHGDAQQRGDTETTRSLVLRFLAALNSQRKTAELVARFASDPTLPGHVMAFEAGFPGYQVIADEVIADGDRVAVRFHTRQRHGKSFMGVPATGLESTITGIVIYRVENSKIAEHWQQADLWRLMRLLQPDADVTKQQFIESKARRAVAPDKPPAPLL